MKTNGATPLIRTYEELLRTADAFTDSRTLIAGVELDLFTHIGKKPATAKEIARRADASRKGWNSSSTP